MAVEDNSDMADGSLAFGSMCATNTVSKTPPFQPPGSASESVPDSLERNQMPVIPPVAPPNTAGPGDKGGVLQAGGVDPRSAGPWEQAGEDTGRWTTSRQPFNPKDI